jgi:hypothetical protein
VEVQINNHKIDFELEKEENTADIVASIGKWAQERDLIFSAVFIDDDTFYPDEVPTTDLDSISTINCIVESRSDIVFQSISEAINYSDRVVLFIEDAQEQNEVDLDEIYHFTEGINWTVTVSNYLFSLLELSADDIKYKDITAAKLLEDLQKDGEALEVIKDAKAALGKLEQLKDFFVSVREIMQMLLTSENLKSLIMKSIESPDTIINLLQEIKKQGAEELQNIQNIAVAFQTGKDAEGVERINRFLDFFYTYSRTCYQVIPVFNLDIKTVIVNEISLEEKNEQFSDLLSEVTDALENEDMISLADIMEYEIMPAMEDLEEYIDTLLNQIGGSND